MPGVRVRGFISGLGLTFGHALERAFRGGLRLEALGTEHGQGLAVWLLRQDRAFVGRVVLGHVILSSKVKTVPDWKGWIAPTRVNSPGEL